MGVITTGETFSSGDQVTSTKLNDIANQATFTSAADTTDNATLTVSGGKLKVKDDGIATTQLATDAVETVNIKDLQVTTAKLAADSVEFAKMQNISTAKVIGRTTAGSGDPEEVSILDEDNMATDSNTALATQQSIKAYVDAEVPAAAIQLKAKCSFDGTQASPTAVGGFNIASVSKTTTGDYTVTFTSAITNPVANVTALNASTANPVDASIYSISTTSVRIITGTNTGGLMDFSVHLTVF